MKFVWRCSCFLLLAMTLGSAENDVTTTTSPAPTFSPLPTHAPTISPAPSSSNSTNSTVPTISPAPTTSPAPSNPPTTSPAPSNPPTISPAPSNPPTTSPAPSPSPSAASPAPSVAPTNAPAPHHHHHHRPSMLHILGKTLAWLIIIGLSVLLFGFIMSNRYRIYYYVRSTWYSFLRLEGTAWVIRKLRLERFFGDQESSLNEIIFENNLQEGLLGMQMQNA